MKVSVKVPATTANLGAGFDCLGMALPIYNTITIEETVILNDISLYASIMVILCIFYFFKASIIILLNSSLTFSLDQLG